MRFLAPAAGCVLLFSQCGGATTAVPIEPDEGPCRSCNLSVGPTSNEPAGHVQIFSNDGRTKNFGAPSYAKAWGDPDFPSQPILPVKENPGFNTVHVVSDERSPTGSAVEFVYWEGKKDGFAGVAFFTQWPTKQTYRNLYIRLLYQMDPNWTHHSSGTTKIMYLGYGGGKPTRFYLSNRWGKLELVDQTGDGHDPIFQAGGVTMQPGQWYEIEMVIYGQSSFEAADGGMEMWVDGKRIDSWKQRRGRDPDQPPTNRIWQFADGTAGAKHTRFSGAQLGGWFGGSPKDEPGKPQDEWLRWGFLYISGLP